MVRRRRTAILVLLTACSAFVLVSCGRGTTPEAQDADLWLKYEVTGGIAGFCERLEVRADGTATVTSCRGPTRTFTLDGSDRRAIETWVERYTAVDETRADPEGAADRMVLRLVLHGKGTEIPSPTVLQGMFDLAARLAVGTDRY